MNVSSFLLFTSSAAADVDTSSQLMASAADVSLALLLMYLNFISNRSWTWWCSMFSLLLLVFSVSK